MPYQCIPSQRKHCFGIMKHLSGTKSAPSLLRGNHLTQLDTSFSASSKTTWVSQHQKSKTILDFNEARDDAVVIASAELYANHVHLALDR